MTLLRPAGRTGRIVARMTARDRDEAHRVATPLELFFDLCFVVAVAQAGIGLVHAVAERPRRSGVVGYLFVFFGIWWAWMNFTWFASAYDTDDVPVPARDPGADVPASWSSPPGCPRAFDDDDWAVAVIGYIDDARWR